MKKYKDIYEILDDLRQRPSMYLGSKKSLTALVAFVSGLRFAQMDEGNPPFSDFSSWIARKVEGMSSTMSWLWMIEEWGNEKAFDKFFELLDEYRNCKSVCLSRAIIRNHKPTFVQIINGERVPPEKPLELCIAQFVPSEVYYLLEIYTWRQDKYFPYQNSIDEVKKVALSQWGVLENEWFDF
ncbi:hypothetical protein Riv7116_5988 [Rivularia sp. PCC 7116]|uniref:hypothetical protein n=1 Tax=Rivularia sp. PCC 7116 TaxID=373994 RepID=UPI00029EE6ED|nr:hypothetical protein [Rivularia sp. PCC 7116]AFY58349.1 hypothetical protein Riv7116_5988 [Rivularia sp. PCC 7116]